jgi:hypothetical protein
MHANGRLWLQHAAAAQEAERPGSARGGGELLVTSRSLVRVACTCLCSGGASALDVVVMTSHAVFSSNCHVAGT